MPELEVRRQRFLSRVKEDIAEVACARLSMILRQGMYIAAEEHIREISQQYNDVVHAVYNDPSQIPIDYTRLPPEWIEILEEHGYATLGDLKADWPCKILNRPRIDREIHHAVWLVLMQSGLLDKNIQGF